MNELISALLIVWIWAMLMCAYLVFEKLRDKKKRRRFHSQLHRYRANG